MQRLLIALAILLPLSASAQDQRPIPTSSNSSPGVEIIGSREDYINSWGHSARYLDEGKQVYIVTVAHLDRRKKCKVVSSNDTQIVCAEHGHERSRTFQRDEVAAIISPAVRGSGIYWVSGFLAASAGLITGACLLAPVTLGAAIPSAILGGLVLLATGAFAFGDDGGRGEEFLYRQPGLDLSRVHLR